MAQFNKSKYVKNIEEISTLFSSKKHELDERMATYIQSRIDYFKYRYSFLNMPIKETDSWEIYALKKRLTVDTASTNRYSAIGKHSSQSNHKTFDNGNGKFKFVYEKIGTQLSYDHCLRVKITYPQNKVLIEKCKEYENPNPSDKKFYTFKQWVANDKEHAIYCDNKEVLDEIKQFITDELNGQARFLN